MRISRKSKIAFQILLDIAAHSAVGKVITISQLSSRHSLSHSYLELIFSQLKSAQLIRSHRGPGGGYSLGRNPQDISFYDVVTILEKPESVCQDLGVFLWEGLANHMNTQMKCINLSEALKRSSIVIEKNAKSINLLKACIKLPKVSISKKIKKDSMKTKQQLGPNSVFMFGNYLKGIC